MIISVVGPVLGRIEEALKGIQRHRIPIDWLLCTGSFGVWPDHAKLDRATRQREGSGDFARWYLQGPENRLQTLFVSGVHEDHDWLKNRLQIGNMEVLSNIHWLANGYKTIIGDHETQLRVTGFGKVYSESTFNGQFTNKSKRHYTRQEFEKACSSGPTDILMLHEPPGNEWTRRLIFATRPKIIVHSGRKVQEPYVFMDTPTLSLSQGEYQFLEYTEEGGFRLI